MLIKETDMPVITGASALESSTSDGNALSSGTSDKIGLGVGLGIGIPSLIIAFIQLVWPRIRRRASLKKHKNM